MCIVSLPFVALPAAFTTALTSMQDDATVVLLAGMAVLTSLAAIFGLGAIVVGLLKQAPEGAGGYTSEGFQGNSGGDEGEHDEEWDDRNY